MIFIIYILFILIFYFYKKVKNFFYNLKNIELEKYY